MIHYDFLYGVMFGTFLLLFIAWIDKEWLGRVKNINPLRFMFYLMASCWELLFFTGGLVIGRFMLK